MCFIAAFGHPTIVRKSHVLPVFATQTLIFWPNGAPQKYISDWVLGLT